MQWDTDDFVGMGMGEVSHICGCTQLLLCLLTESHTPEQWCLARQLGQHMLGCCTRPQLALGSKVPSVSF